MFIFNFDDIGTKIKDLATALCYITIVLDWVASLILFFVFVFDRYMSGLCWIPIVSAVVGPFLIWVSFWSMYAFGELVENSGYLVRLKRETTPPSTKKVPITAASEADAPSASFGALVTEDAKVTTGWCSLCENLMPTKLTGCMVEDETGTHYRLICDACMKKYHAVPKE